MSLRVWLPLNGDLRNNGLSNITSVTTNATVNANGKIGSCYSFNGSSNYIMINYGLPLTAKNWSYCCWAKLNNNSSNMCLYSQRTEVTNTQRAIFIVANKTFYFDDGTRLTKNFNSSTNLLVWNHFAFIREGNKLNVYVNGVLEKTSDITTFPSILGTNTVFGGSQGSNTSVTSNYLNGYLNDIRIYDHALSAKEVKEISKGLVCHYKLDSKYITDNLIINGFGENGMENWDSGSFSTTEIPPNQSNIKASYLGATTKEYIPLNTSHSYTISAWLKANNATSGTIYPSIYPYDYDKKFIANYNCKDGFSTIWKTTLAQPLKKGDTKIYATDLSNWSTATNNHYYHVAIFGYKNSIGYIYPDMEYTADSPVFGTYSDKSNIDKTNNIITLKSAYTGEDRPAGTIICQATEGGTYVYPFGGCGVGGLQDWVFKTTTFIPKNSGRLKYAKYIRWSTYNNLAYLAGNQLIDNDDNSNTVYDCSGYNNHAVINGDITITLNTPRNSLATHFTSGSYIRLTDFSSADFANSYTFSWWGKFTQTSSHMMWGYSNGNRLNLYMMGGNFYWNTGDGGGNPFNVSASTYADNVWHHIIVTGDGTTTKLYIDGEFKNNAKTYKPITGTILVLNGWDTGTPYKFNGDLSDFRIYATALSAEDVKELYNTPISISNNGFIFTQGEYKEV